MRKLNISWKGSSLESDIPCGLYTLLVISSTYNLVKLKTQPVKFQFFISFCSIDYWIIYLLLLLFCRNQSWKIGILLEVLFWDYGHSLSWFSSKLMESSIWSSFFRLWNMKKKAWKTATLDKNFCHMILKIQFSLHELEKIIKKLNLNKLLITKRKIIVNAVA